MDGLDQYRVCNDSGSLNLAMDWTFVMRILDTYILMKKQRVSKFWCDLSRFHVTPAAGHDFRIKDLEMTFSLSGQVKVVQGKSSSIPEEAEFCKQPSFSRR
jgi:hypothetical protein